MDSSLKKYNSFIDLKKDSIIVKPKVKKAILQEELSSFFKNLRQASNINSKSPSFKNAGRSH